MAWDAYCDRLLASKLTSVSVVGLDGSKWAAKGATTPTDAELADIAKRRTLPEGHENLIKSFHYAGKSFMFIRKEEDQMMGKCSGGGLCIAWGKQAMLIAVYGESLQPGEATVLVTKLRDYLRDSGY